MEEMHKSHEFQRNIKERRSKEESEIIKKESGQARDQVEADKQSATKKEIEKNGTSIEAIEKSIKDRDGIRDIDRVEM